MIFLLSLQNISRAELQATPTPEISDSLYNTLEEVDVVATQNVPVSKGGSISLDTSELYGSLRLMGEADAVNFIKRLAGVTTTGDYGSGLLIDGFESSQTLFSINDVPVFFPYRFGGVFSTFNTPHFKSVDFERGIHGASMPNRLGARIELKTDKDIPSKVNGMVNVGMLSSSLSITLPIADKFRLSFSGRISYVDQLYGPFFKGSTDLSYQFGDLNLNALWKIDESNILSLDAFGNKDKLKYDDSHYSMATHLSWGNQLVSLSWNHSGKTDMVNRIFYSGFQNKLKLEMPQLLISTPSSISMAGVSGNFSNRIHDSSIKIDYGYELHSFQEKPQIVEITGYEFDKQAEAHYNYPFEARIYGDIRIPLLKRLYLLAGLSASCFHNHSYNDIYADPRITLTYSAGPGAFNLHLGSYSQYIHQVGFSQIGLASDFWIAASKEVPAQRSYDLELDYTGHLNNFSFSITGYFRRVLSQPDYVGQILSLIDQDYNPFDYIFNYIGYNTGFNLVSNLKLDKVTTNIGLGYGIARRYDTMANTWIRGNTEPGFTLNADVDYVLNHHWQFGAQFRFATGRPFTPILSMYMIAGNVIKDYGLPNSELFPDNHQLDLSATWKGKSKVKTTELTHFVNFSIINAYGHKNVEIMTYVFNPETNNIRLRKVYSLYRFLPSISYTLQF